MGRREALGAIASAKHLANPKASDPVAIVVVSRTLRAGDGLQDPRTLARSEKL